MFEFPVVYVDIETTGGSYRTSRILEIAAIRVENGVTTQEFHTILNPETRIPPQITTLTGIHPHHTIGKPTFADIAPQLATILDGAIFIAHNVKFDYSFIKQEYALLGTNFSPKLLCTVRLSRALYPYNKGHSLAVLIERHSIPVSARHRAFDDAQAIKHFAELAYAEHGHEQFADAVSLQLKSRSLPAHLDAADIDLIENVPGVYIFRDETRLPIYVGKSVTLKKRVLSHFQSTASKELKISQQVHHVETIKTGSEFAALILESKLIKELQPIYNRLLRRASQYAMFVASYENDYAHLQITMGNIDDSIEISTVYGIYRTKMQAKQKADEQTRIFQLCPKLMGLEKSNHACFWYSLGKCKGACIGKEPAELYNRRFELALQHSKVSSWQYDSAVQVPLSEQGDSVVIDNWIIRGFLDSEGVLTMSDESPSFDVDEYKIIRRFLQQNHQHIMPYSEA